MSPSLSACPLRAGRGLSALVGFPKLLYLLQQRVSRDRPETRPRNEGRVMGFC